jgi:hypothetical protein
VDGTKLSTWGPGFCPLHPLCLLSLQLNSGYYVSGSSTGFQGGQITLSMQKVSSLLPLPSRSASDFPEGRHLHQSPFPGIAAHFFFIPFYTCLLNNCRT